MDIEEIIKDVVDICKYLEINPLGLSYITGISYETIQKYFSGDYSSLPTEIETTALVICRDYMKGRVVEEVTGRIKQVIGGKQ